MTNIESTPAVGSQVELPDFVDGCGDAMPGFRDMPWIWGEAWNIGLVPWSLDSLLADPGRLADAVWPLRESRAHYYSDPWLVESRNGRHVFYERLNRKTGLGEISCSAILRERNEWSLTPPRVVVPQRFHQSYPCLFEEDGTWYLIPEACQTGHVLIYQALEYPWLWGPPRILIQGFAGLDPTLIKHQGKYWLFAGRLGDAPNATLHLFHADRLLGPWHPQGGNPVVTGLRGSRPAGRVMETPGGLLRPGQDSSVTYGQGLLLFRIETMGFETYEESPIVQWSPPQNFPYLHGLHTLSAGRDFCLIDAKCFTGLKRVFERPVMALKAKRAGKGL